MVARDKEDLSGQQIGNYEIESHIAARKASDLFLARDVKLERPVFLEVLRATVEEDEDLAARFRRRMEIVSQLKDPGIAIVSDFDTTEDGFPYAVIDYFPGSTLADQLAEQRRSQQPSSVIESLEFIKQIAQALSTAHAAGLIHHDLRPENIAVKEDGTPILIDLGIPIVLGPARMGVNGSEAETLDYASPEELEGKALTRRSNIYSLGVILYELLAGHRPHLPNLPFDIFPQANTPKEQPLEEARPELAGETYRLVRNCLWRQEWSRFETADEMITAIETAIFAEQELPKAAAWTPQRSRPAFILIPIALVVLGLLAFFLLRGLGGGNAEASEPTAPADGTSAAGIAANTPEPENSPTPSLTPTIVLPTESANDPSIVILAPGPNREFTIQETINFDWFWPTQPGAGRHFVVYLSDGAQEFALGSVSKPNNGAAYRLSVAGEDIPITGETLTWQVRLEDIDGGEVFFAGDPVPIIIRSGEPTATPTGTLPAVTETASPTPCAVSAPPSWVEYVIREGDSLSELAERGNVEVETLLQVNCLPNILLSVGQRILVPGASVPRTPTPRPTATNPPPPPPTATNPPPPPPPTNTRAPEPPTDTPEPPTATSAPPTEEPPTSTPGIPPTETSAPP